MGRKKLGNVNVGGKVPPDCRAFWVDMIKSFGFVGQKGKPMWGQFFIAVWKGDLIIVPNEIIIDLDKGNRRRL